ncbi:MAG: CAF17-like 4Fe-4S cluster assembly/insertion protein YgfZ [Rhodospirillales bacterium]
MGGKGYVELAGRGVLAVSGPDARAFLQGLVSNDVLGVSPARAIYAALLTAQGRYLHDFFIAEIAGALCLDCEAARRDDLMRRLKMYKLRSKIALEDLTPRLAVAALPGAGAPASLGLAPQAGAAKELAGGGVFVDPRLAAMGARAILPREKLAATMAAAGFSPAAAGEYETLRLTLGLPDGSRDLPIEKALLLENGFDELNGVDWKKGCYVGQELTARTKYRGLVRKRLLPVRIDGPAPAPGTEVKAGGDEAGEMRSASGALGLALLRLEFVDKLLTAGDAKLVVSKPEWVRLSDAEATTS